MHFKRRIVSLVLIASFAFPTASLAAASTISEALGVKGSAAVSRGVFIRASIITLGLSVDMKNVSKAYDTYPKEWRAYVQVADSKGLLSIFGKNADLTKSITRGEALQVIAKLHSWDKEIEMKGRYRDVQSGTAMDAVVHLALTYGWMRPLRTVTFGVKTVLTGRDAVTLLTRVASDAKPAKTRTIRTIQKKENDSVVDLASKSFRNQVKQLLDRNYLYPEKLRNASGATAMEFVESIGDPYTMLMEPVEAKEFKDRLAGVVAGIGVHVDMGKNKEVLITAVLPNTPAEAAGLQAGDIILSADGTLFKTLEFDEAVRLVRGPEGTPVKLKVLRKGGQLSFTITRALIDIPDLEISYRNDVAVIDVTQFGAHIANGFDENIDEILAEDPVGIIIDLRDNPGGYLESAEQMLSDFLPERSLYLQTEYRSSVDRAYTRFTPTVPDDLPVIVLVNEWSASAAEIAAGALQDYGRATIIGTKTFGKGTVQSMFDFPNGASLKYTIAEWLTPLGNPINEVGVVPDFVVTQSDAGDNQMEKALELLRQ